jgi:mRNA interferase MazF/mRNA interferase ChpB
MKGFAVALSGAGTGVTGVVQVDQLRALDMTVRRGRPTSEHVPDFIMNEVLEKLAVLVQ